MATAQELQDQINALSEQLLKLSTMAYDATRHFGNMEQVASSGKAGALSLSDTLSGAPVGDAGQVRANIGAYGSGSSTDLYSIICRAGIELYGPSFLDFHYGDDTKDYSSRIIAEGEYMLSVLSNMTLTGYFSTTGDMHCGGRFNGGGLGAYAYASVGSNVYGTVVQKVINDVTGKNLYVGRVCKAYEMNIWDNNADNSWVTGTWVCQSQVALTYAAGSHLCTFVKSGD